MHVVKVATNNKDLYSSQTLGYMRIRKAELEILADYPTCSPISFFSQYRPAIRNFSRAISWLTWLLRPSVD